MSSRYGFHIDVASRIMSQMYVGFLHLVAIESAEKIAVATATHVGRVHPSGVLQHFFLNQGVLRLDWTKSGLTDDLRTPTHI